MLGYSRKSSPIHHPGKPQHQWAPGRTVPPPPGQSCERASMLTRLNASLVKFLREEDGPTAVEYAVMLALIIVVCITAITTLGSNASQSFSYVGSQLKPATGS